MPYFLILLLYRLSEILQRRFITPWLKPDAIFKRSVLGKRQAQCLKIIHEFTLKVS
jgi:cytochrome P450 family 4/sesquiterpenoid omega-hydroxylase